MSKINLDFITVLSVNNTGLYRIKNKGKKLFGYYLIRDIIDSEIDHPNRIWHNYVATKYVNKIYHLNRIHKICYHSKHLHILPKRRGANNYGI